VRPRPPFRSHAQAPAAAASGDDWQRRHPYQAQGLSDPLLSLAAATRGVSEPARNSARAW